MRRVVGVLALVAALAPAPGCGSFFSREKHWQRSAEWPTFPPEVHFELTDRSGSLPENQVRYAILPDPSASLVELDVRVDVGAADDPRGKHGLAHLAEHVLFLGRAGGAGRLESRLRAATVSHNAYTTVDSTHYQDLLLPGELEHALDLEAARFGASCRSVDAESFARERDVVRNEERERHHGVGGLEAIERASYGEGHAYAGNVGGSDAEVAALTLADVCDFVDAYYAPERLGVVIAGNVDADATVAAVRRRFGALPARLGAPHAAIAPAHGASERRRLEADVDGTYLVWAFPMPPRAAALGLESHILTDDVEASLEEALEEQPETSGVQAILAGGARAPLVVVAVGLGARADVDTIAHAVEARLDRFSRGADSQATPFVLRHRYFMRLLFRLEALAERTDLFADYLQFAPARFSYVTEYARLADDRLRLADARGLYAPARAARFLLVPGEHPARASRAETAFAGEAREDKEDLDVDPGEAHRPLAVPAAAQPLPPARRFTLANGLQVVLQPAPGAIPLTVARLVIAVGSAHEPVDKAGVAELAAHTFARGQWVSSTRLLDRGFAGGRDRLTGVDSEEEVDDSVDVGPDSTEITARFPSRDVADVLHMLAFRGNGFADPSFIEFFLRATEALFRHARHGMGSVSVFAFATGIFGPGHPYARTAGMTLRSLRRIDPEDIVAFMDRHYVGANTTLILTGAFDPGALEAGIRDEFGRWPAGQRTAPVTTPARERHAPLLLGVATGEDPAATEQLELTLGFGAPAGIDSRRAARLVLARMLELRAAAVRERIGASYGLHADLVTAAGPGAYMIAGEVDARRAGDALALLLARLADLRAGVGFDEDFARARRTVLAELVARSSSPTALAARWSFLTRFGQPADYHARLAREVAALSPAAVRALVDAELVPGHEVIVLTGPRATVAKAYADAKLPAPHFMKRWPPVR